MGILTKNEILSEIYKILGIAFLLITCAFIAPMLYTTTRPSLPVFYTSINIFDYAYLWNNARMIGSYGVWLLICYIMLRISFTFLISGWKISKMENALNNRFDLNIIGGILCGFTMTYSLLLLFKILNPLYFFPLISTKITTEVEYLVDIDKSILINTTFLWVMIEIIRFISARILKIGIKELVTINEVPEPNLIKSILIRLKIMSILRRLKIK